MTDPQPGHTSVIFEVHFDKLAPSGLRDSIATDCTNRIDQLIPASVRQTWINKPYTGGSSPADLLFFINKLFTDENPAVTPEPTPKEDFYCWLGDDRRCYSTFAVYENGVPVTVNTQTDGYSLTCTLIAVMVTVPTTS